MKQILITFLTITLMLPSQVYGDCVKPATVMTKGQIAPCAGILLSKEKEKEIRQDKEKHKLTLEQLGVRNQMIEIYKKDINDVESIVSKERKKAEIWRQRAEKSTEKLIESESGRGRRDWMFYLLGALTVVGAGFAVGAASK